MSPRVIFIAAAAVLPIPGAVWALEYGFGAGYSARYTDNAARVPQGAVSDTEHSVVGSGRVLIQTPRLDLSANGNIELQSYAHDTFEPESYETLNANAVYTFARDRLTWTVDDSLQNTRIDSLLAVTPDNLEQTNRFSTGPNITLRTSSRNTIGFIARYENDWYEQSDDLSNDRGIADLNWKYRLSDPVAFVLRYRYESVRYRDETPGANYVFDSVTAGLEGQMGTTITYRFEYGPGRVRQDLQDTVTDSVGIAEFVRQIRSDTGFRIAATTSVSDSGRTRQLDPVTDPTLQVSGVGAGQPDFVYVREGTIEYFSAVGNLKYRLAATARDENFKISPEDALESGGGVTMEYEFTPRLIGLASGNFTRSDFTQLARVDDDTLASAGLRYRFQRNWDAGLVALHEQRASTDPAQEYEENSILASVSYHFSSKRISVGE